MPTEFLSLADIATELKQTKARLSNFISQSRLKGRASFEPSKVGPGNADLYSRHKADQLKRAFTDRIIKKTWKKSQA